MPDPLIVINDTLRGIAAAALKARAQANSMGRLPWGVGEELLCDVEFHLTSLLAQGVVPADTGRPIVTGALPMTRPSPSPTLEDPHAQDPAPPQALNAAPQEGTPGA